MRNLFKKSNKTQRVRINPRFPNFLLAELSADNGWAAEGYIKEMSKTGASLSVNRGGAVPDRIRVAIPSRQVAREADVVWRQRRAIGIQFARPIDLPNGTPSWLDQVRE